MTSFIPKFTPNGISFSTQINGEQSLTDNAEGETHHLRRDIEWLTGRDLLSPSFEHGKRRIGHQGAKGCQMVPVKGWLDETALVQPGRSIVGQEALAQQWLE